MPNWCYNGITIKGNKEKTRDFLNKGISDGFITLPESTLEIEVIISNLPKDRNLRLSAYYPQPDIIKAADTTFKPNDHPEIAAQQLKECGVIGWYDWNTTYWGTKWDSLFEDVQYVESNDNGEITFFIETAWSPPINWLVYVQEQFPDLDFEMNYEEHGMCFCGIVATVRNDDGTPEICDNELDWDELHPEVDDEEDDE